MWKKQKKDKTPFEQNILPTIPKRQYTTSTPTSFDIYLFFTTLLLVLIGVMMIFSSSAILAKEQFGDTSYFLKKELLFFVIGFTALFCTKSIDYQKYGQWIYPLLGLTLILMLISFVPAFSHSAKGALRWIRIGSFSFQPSEFAKLTTVIFMAYLLAKKGDRVREFLKGFLPIACISGTFILLILAQKDLGSAFVLGSVVCILLFVAGTRWTYLIGIFLVSLPVLYFSIFSVAFRKQRILAFLDPWKYKLDSGFQVIQSFVAFKSGSFTGLGLGESKQKLFYLPEAHTDFIFSVIGEEFGIVGVISIITLFLFLIMRGLMIALKAQDRFGTYLALGITCLLGLEAFINFGVVMGLLPTKGLTLPFISYGGTSLITSLIAIGILLNISTRTGEET